MVRQSLTEAHSMENTNTKKWGLLTRQNSCQKQLRKRTRHVEKKLKLSFSKNAFGFVSELSDMFLLSNHQIIQASLSVSHPDVVKVCSTDKQSWNNDYQITSEFLSYRIITVQFMVIKQESASRTNCVFHKTNLLFTYNSMCYLEYKSHQNIENDNVVKHYKHYNWNQLKGWPDGYKG